MTQKDFNELKDIIENRLHAQSNYQYVVLRHILKNDLSFKSDICLSLSKANNNKRDLNFYKNCPVWNVLLNKKLISAYRDESENYYGINKQYTLTHNEEIDLIEILTKEIRGFN